MKDLSPRTSSRRSFLRGAAVAAIFSPALGVPMVEAQSSSSGSEDIAVLGNITVDNKVYEHDAILKGSLRFLRMPKPPVIIQWIDSFGRIAGERVLPAPSSLVKPLDFSFDLRTGLTYINSVRVKANGVVQAVSTRFMRSPAASPWNDYQVITWAYYPDGYYDQLRAAGVNATIASRPCWTTILTSMLSRWPGRSTRITTRISRCGGILLPRSGVTGLISIIG